MRAKVRAGRLDGAAVDAVLEAAGPRVPRRREALSGLTAREVEVPQNWPAALAARHRARWNRDNGASVWDTGRRTSGSSGNPDPEEFVNELRRR